MLSVKDFFYKTTLAFFLLVLFSCHIPKHSSEAKKKDTESEELTSSPKLIFITFKITKDTTIEHSEISLAKTQIAEGELKKPALEDPYKPSYANKLRCVYTSDKGDTIYTATIDHPLYKKFEYTNDDGSIGYKEVVLKESTFSLRTDYDKKMKFIIIFESIGNKSEIEIAKIEIPL